MAKRHRDALAIQAGACNPRAILNSIQNAITELDTETYNKKAADSAAAGDPNAWFKAPRSCSADTDTITNDPAIQLMVHQLAFVCKLTVDATDYAEAVLECEAK
jgi:hypothetical protein